MNLIYVLLPYLIPLAVLAYYLKVNWPEIMDKPFLLTTLISGTLCFIVGQLISRANPQIGSTLKLFGTCVFFTGVAFDTGKRFKKETGPEKEESKN